MRIRGALVLFIILVSSHPAHGDTEEVDRFKREYPPAAKRLEERFARAKGSCRLSGVEAGDSKTSRLDEAIFDIDHGYEKLTIKRWLPGGGASPQFYESVYCVGEHTDFYLTRLPGAKGFAVEGIGSTDSDRSAYLTLFGRFVKSHLGVFGWPLTRTMASPDFRLKNAERITKNGHSLVKVDYEIGAQEPKHQVSVVLDPDYGWAIRSSDYRPANAAGVRFVTEIEYGPSRDGFSLPRLVTIRDHVGVSSCEFSNWKFEGTPEAEFGMPHYGLPDLTAKTTSSPSSLPYWLVGFALAGLALSFFLKRAGSRNA